MLDNSFDEESYGVYKSNRSRVSNASNLVDTNQPTVVRKHFTMTNSIYRTYECLDINRSYRDRLIIQPHYNYMKYMCIPYANKSQPADGICAHFLLHGFNRLQKSPVNVGCWSSEARRLVLGTQTGEFTLWEVIKMTLFIFIFKMALFSLG